MSDFLMRAKILSIIDGDSRAALRGAIPSVVPVRVSIAKDGNGSFFLFCENEAGVAIADTWHETLEEAQEQAATIYELEPWEPS